MNTNLRWWGWGTLDKAFPAAMAERLLTYLRDERGFPLQEGIPKGIDSMQLPEPSLREASRQALLDIVDMHATPLARLTHAYGKGYLDLLRLRQGDVQHPPDAVAWPTHTDEVLSLLQTCQTHDVAVVPFGGGTSTVGEVEPVAHAGGAISLDMRGLNRMVSIDPRAGAATFQAGILGPDLEAMLNSYGCTLSHYPQSFEHSTLGGWVATASVGQNAIKVGGIDNLVYGMQVVLPDGRRVNTDLASGGLRQFWVGSRGALGVITEVAIRIAAQPAYRLYRTAMFPDWETAITCLRLLVQMDVHPAVIDLADAEATILDSRLHGPDVDSFYRTRSRLRSWQYESRDIDPQTSCRLVMLFEGELDDVGWRSALAERLVKQCGGLNTGRDDAQRWQKLRFLHPYLRDDLLDQSIGTDTIQTRVSWTNLHAVYEETCQSLRNALGLPCVVQTHIQHAWNEGAQLSFTWLLPQAENEIERWQTVRLVAATVSLANGGTLDHHFAVELPPEVAGVADNAALTDIVLSAKHSFDPKGILNPKKIGMETFDIHKLNRVPSER